MRFSQAVVAAGTGNHVNVPGGNFDESWSATPTSSDGASEGESSEATSTTTTLDPEDTTSTLPPSPASEMIAVELVSSTEVSSESSPTENTVEAERVMSYPIASSRISSVVIATSTVMSTSPLPTTGVPTTERALTTTVERATTRATITFLKGTDSRGGSRNHLRSGPIPQRMKEQSTMEKSGVLSDEDYYSNSGEDEDYGAVQRKQADVTRKLRPKREAKV